jgi:hypothetical protein
MIRERTTNQLTDQSTSQPTSQPTNRPTTCSLRSTGLFNRKYLLSCSCKVNQEKTVIIIIIRYNSEDVRFVSSIVDSIGLLAFDARLDIERARVGW